MVLLKLGRGLPWFFRNSSFHDIGIRAELIKRFIEISFHL